MELEDQKFWSMRHDPDINTIELGWKNNTSSMTADDFKLALEHLASHIGERSATGALIDVRTFQFRTTPELDQWRLENIIPAYNAGGLKRFAYLLPPGVEYRPGGGGDAAHFITDYFDEPERARAWLREA